MPVTHSFVGQDFDFWCSHEQRQDGQGEQERWQVSKGAAALELKPLNTKAARQRQLSLWGRAQGQQAKTGASRKIAVRRDALRKMRIKSRKVTR